MGRPLRAAWWTRIILALVGVVFLGVFPYLTAVNNPNENVRTFMTMAIVERGTLKIDHLVERHGWINDMAKVPDKAGTEHLFSVKGPLVSYLGVPPYWAFVKLEAMRGVRPPVPTDSVAIKRDWLRRATFVMRFFTIQIPLFLWLIWFDRFLRRVTADPVFRLAALVATGLGTNYLAYSQMFVSHAAFAAAAFTAFALIHGARMEHRDERFRPTRIAFLAGLFTGMATVLEYHALVVSAVLALYGVATFFRPKRLVAFAAGGAIDVAILMLFQWRAYGNPLTPGHKMLENASFKAYHVRGFFGIEPPNGEHIKELLFNKTFGFLGTSPFMWLALLALPAAIFWASRNKHDRLEQRLAVLVGVIAMTVLVVTVSGAVVWRGGWTIGPRLLGAAPPFFAAAAVFGLERLSQQWRALRTPLRGIAGGLACASVVQIGFPGVLYNTLPEDLTRPLPDFAIPYTRVGFSPWHLGDVFGWHGAGFFWIVLACGAAAALLAAFFPADDRSWKLFTRVGIAACVFAFALRPAFSTPKQSEPFEIGDRGLGFRRNFVMGWEPETGNPLLRLRTLAEKQGEKQPCIWGELAHAEHVLGFVDEARMHVERAHGLLRCP
ncbi:MAG: hypothetical protein ACXVEE_05395 [Polyangiales bacterium]